MYTVMNIAGGCAYQGKSLQKACEAAISCGNEPYVISAKGKRPVIENHDMESDRPSFHIGEFGQSYDDFLKEIEGE